MYVTPVHAFFIANWVFANIIRLVYIRFISTYDQLFAGTRSSQQPCAFNLHDAWTEAWTPFCLVM